MLFYESVTDWMHGGGWGKYWHYHVLHIYPYFRVRLNFGETYGIINANPVKSLFKKIYVILKQWFRAPIAPPTTLTLTLRSPITVKGPCKYWWNFSRGQNSIQLNLIYNIKTKIYYHLHIKFCYLLFITSHCSKCKKKNAKNRQKSLARDL